MSNPALQNAEMDRNTAIQMPRNPYSLHITGIRVNAPKSSVKKVTSRMNIAIRAIPSTRGAAKVSCSMLRSLREILLPERRENEAEARTTPRPPIWIMAMITIWPNIVHPVAVSLTTSPVTQVAEVAVKMASENDAGEAEREEMGSMSSAVPIRMMAAKPRTTILNEESFLRVMIDATARSFSKPSELTGSHIEPTYDTPLSRRCCGGKTDRD